ncbi:hypothetical protein [Hazenella coriacea]|uniref:Protein kinase-like protein n=1 Tax=Hazenella coriacea TaxID=1179467 RepID=A0A4R3LA84_9BACL|nr:hypothetical protein [Hazenella coriacea]TCS96602.1 protein kinase-like protein [Hazenella coriacea]
MKYTFSNDQGTIEYLREIVASGKMQDHHPLLGEGLSGQVYEFENYAVKVFKEKYSENDDFIMLNHLHNHSGFPNLHYKEEQFMVVDKVSGYTLGQALKSGDSLNDEIFRQIEVYVEDCYRDGIIAHDLHLNNIMIDKDNHIKIIDVGRFFYTTNQESYTDQIREELENIKYHLFSFPFSSKKRRRRRHKHSSFSSRSFSSSSFSYSSSSRRKHRRKRRRFFSS